MVFYFLFFQLMYNLNTVAMEDLSKTQREVAKEVKSFIRSNKDLLIGFATTHKTKSVINNIRAGFSLGKRYSKNTLDMVFATCSIYGFVQVEVIKPARQVIASQEKMEPVKEVKMADEIIQQLEGMPSEVMVQNVSGKEIEKGSAVAFGEVKLAHVLDKIMHTDGGDTGVSIEEWASVDLQGLDNTEAVEKILVSDVDTKQVRMEEILEEQRKAIETDEKIAKWSIIGVGVLVILLIILILIAVL